MVDWYCSIDDQTYGPLTDGELGMWVAEGRLRPDDWVARDGEEQWTPASEIPGLFGGPGSGAMVAPPPHVQMAPPPGMYGPPQKANGLAIAGMVIGICSNVLCCAWYLAIPLAIVGGILSGIGLSKSRQTGTGRGMAIAGLVCSIVTMVLAALVIAGIFASSMSI